MKMKTLAAAWLLAATLYAGSLSDIQTSISDIVTQADQQITQDVSTVIGTTSSSATIGSAYLEQTEDTIEKETELVSSGGSKGVFQNATTTTSLDINIQKFVDSGLPLSPIGVSELATAQVIFTGGGRAIIDNGSLFSAATFIAFSGSGSSLSLSGVSGDITYTFDSTTNTWNASGDGLWHDFTAPIGWLGSNERVRFGLSSDKKTILFQTLYYLNGVGSWSTTSSLTYDVDLKQFVANDGISFSLTQIFNADQHTIYFWQSQVVVSYSF